ncbi:kinase-like domain-containing protein [Rhizophagus clarus]|uniref:Kinase-like domain-containing protein n=1 Tax=Rhizophagus clarus TaxID=94130 RepID=A0A8H3L847_9GLOM|nr:kinase-like domain-containing protein [Rhizophagus clarus]
MKHIKSIFNISDKSFHPINNHKNCYDPNHDKSWCKECVPHNIIDGWTSENHDIDEFIKDTIYDAKLKYDNNYDINKYPLFLEWVPFDEFKDIKQIGDGCFAKVYSATWIEGKSKYVRLNESWEKRKSEPIKVALKRLNRPQNISAEYLNEVIYFVVLT